MSAPYEIRPHSLPTGVGILLIGHGTRDPVGQQEFLETARRLQQRLPETPVEPCFLELALPSIAQGWIQLAARGVQQVVVAPLLLFAAGHAKQDIPAAITAAAKSTAGLTWSQTQPLGAHDAVLELSARRFDEISSQLSRSQIAESLLLFIGRGSLDAEATAAMHDFATFRHRRSTPAKTQVAFIAMAEPRLNSALNDPLLATFAHVIVQPHLLFAGLLLDEVRCAVAEAARRTPNTSFLIADRLGPGDLLLDAIVDRVAQSFAAAHENGPAVSPVVEERV